MFGGSSAPAEAAAPVNTQQTFDQSNNCAGAATQFTKCMDDNGGNMQICNWYLEQLVRFPPLSSPKPPPLPPHPLSPEAGVHVF